MRLILCLIISMFSTLAIAGEIEALPEDFSLNNKMSIDGAEIAMAVNAQKDVNQNIVYMMNNYSLEEMAQYAVRLNKSDRQTAAAEDRPLPEKLNREILSSKENIAEYLRSRYNLTSQK
ncbi:MAG: hypothetical protein IJ099_05925 [Alphaproteobacteria bacterium]|nr:hypothetical protein [Alphaproteobacteria bacterium]